MEHEEENPEIFGFLSEYVYMGEVPKYTGLNAWKPNIKHEMIDFSNLWLLSHYLLMPKLVNYAIWRLIKWMDAHKGRYSAFTAFSVPDIEGIYDKSPMDSKL